MTMDIAARPTLYKGIQMRSRLEADYAAVLDSEGEQWEYEPTCFAGPDGQWLPDFRVRKQTYIEVKSAHLLSAADGEESIDVYTRIDGILDRISVAFLTDPEAVLELVFHTFGEPVPTLTILRAGARHEWLVFTSSNFAFPLLWPGMGQWMTLAKALASKPEGAPE